MKYVSIESVGNLLSTLPLDEDVREKAIEYYKILKERRMTTGLKTEILVLVLILIAEREVRKFQDWNEILKTLKISDKQRFMNTLYQRMKTVSAKLNIKLRPLSWKEYVDFLLKKLNQEGKKKEVYETAEKIARLVPSRSPSAIAAAAVYVTLKNVRESEVADLVLTTEVSVRNVLRVLKGVKTSRLG